MSIRTHPGRQIDMAEMVLQIPRIDAEREQKTGGDGVDPSTPGTLLGLSPGDTLWAEQPRQGDHPPASRSQHTTSTSTRAHLEVTSQLYL